MTNLLNSPEEVWKDIPGYEGRYQISSFGKVKSFDVIVGARNGHTRIMKGKIRKCGVMPNGYLAISLYNKSVGLQFYVHRLVAMVFIPNPDNKKEVNHINGRKADNRVANLEWATPKENSAHYVLNGLRNTAKGEDAGRAVISEEMAKKIKRLSAVHSTQETLNMLGWGKDKRHLVANIKCGRIWKHI